MPHIIGQDDGVGFGVEGLADTGIGVVGRSKSKQGVLGRSESSDGVSGQSKTGNGVTGTSDLGSGVIGQATSATAPAVAGRNKLAGPGVLGMSNGGIGVEGHSSEPAGEKGTGSGVLGSNEGTGFGVIGLSPKGRGGVFGQSTEGDGVRGQTASPNAAGVVGINNGSGTAVHGSSVGGTGLAGEGATGVLGNGTQTGVKGKSADGIGVSGLHGGADFLATGKYGVYGSSNAEEGVCGVSFAPNKAGVYGQGKPGVFAMGGLIAIGDSGVIGKFSTIGPVTIVGSLQVTGGSKQFVMDHPLDPTNKWLRHAAIESNELKNLYDGVIQLDEDGSAVVQLPSWFEALNRDFRYQLTSIGGAAPNLHIANEVRGNQFKISGGNPESRVSWQVSGIRHDPSAQAHPLVVEEPKEASERGRYAEPELHGQAADSGLAFAPFREAVRHAEEQTRLRKELQARHGG